MFVAIEVTMGQWLFVYLTDGRAISPTVAALGVSGFWGGTTIGRLALATRRVLDLLDRRGLTAAAVAAAACYVGVIVAPAVLVVAFAALAGLLLSPVIPTLSARTVERVGSPHAQRIAGWQLLAGNVGAISVPSATGLLVDAADARVVVLVVGVALAVGLPVLAAGQRVGSDGTTRRSTVGASKGSERR